MTLHKLLRRQLNKAGLNEDLPPREIKVWQDLLESINRSYNDVDQERYLLERSMEISSREMQGMHDKLMITARRAGMTDVATSVLHNIGNVLNSANVSIEILQEYTHHQDIKKLNALHHLLDENKENLIEYLTVDPKGKLVPAYTLHLLKHIEQLHEHINSEIQSLTQHIQHIKTITSMQESLGMTRFVKELIVISETIDTALSMCGGFDERLDIRIEKHYRDDCKIESDRNKLLQIFINLILNAKDAILMNDGVTIKRINIHVDKTSEHDCIISIEDNGIGITKEQLAKIFSFGYTTKKHGHGFGLHSSAIAAKELGGKLEVFSNGLHTGTKFTLTLPESYSFRRNENEDVETFSPARD